MNQDENATWPRQQIAVAIVQHEGLLLIGRREPGTALAGYWEFPGGKLEPGETPDSAAARECLEETGLAVRATGRFAPVTHDYDHARVQLHFVSCVPIEQRQPLPDRFRWVKAEELPNYTFPAANRALIAALTGVEQA